MKLLRLKLNESTEKPVFGSFEQDFIEDYDGYIDPICFAGLNGCGKSNLLELIADIFYYLDDFFSVDFTAREFKTDFEIEYLIKDNHIKATKKTEQIEPEIFVNGNKINIPPREDENFISFIRYKIIEFLPSNIIAYSSGHNERLSHTFNKSREKYENFIREVSENPDQDYFNDLQEMRMIYIDFDSNILILLANYLFRPLEELQIFHDYINIKNLESFRIKIDLRNKRLKDITTEMKRDISDLKSCSTCYFEDRGLHIFDFYINDITRKAFKQLFQTPYKFYQSLYHFKLLNTFDYKFLEILDINLNLVEPQTTIKYKGISDGEHQFVNIIGTLMMMDRKDVLFLLDEPETHFNPFWRTKIVTMINKVSAQRNQEFIITTHSPFLLSDCHGYNVFLFEKIDGKVTFEQVGIETYGASFDTILNKVFKIKQLVSEKSLNEIRDLQKSENLEEINSKIDSYGESIEKFYLYQRIDELNKKKS